jgi:hypothetical protein
MICPMTSSDTQYIDYVPFIFHCQHHRDEPISEQARIALPVCVLTDRMDAA